MRMYPIINILLVSNNIQTSEIDIISWVFIIGVIIFLFWGALYLLGKYNKEKFRFEPRVWSFIIFGLLTLTVLILHAYYNKGEADKQLINMIVIPTMVGIVTSLFAPLVQAFFDSSYIKKEILSAVPIRIYEAANEPGHELQEDLEMELSDAKNYDYSGIDMQIAARCINNILTKREKNKLRIVNFIFPAPEALKRANMFDKVHNEICDSLLTIKESFRRYYSEQPNRRDKQSIDLNFILLPYVPSYHMHHTDKKCWFALVDRNEEGIPYPTTYLYDQNPPDDNSMYATLTAMIITQIKRFTPLSETPTERIAKKSNAKLKENYYSFTLSDGKCDLEKFEDIKKRYNVT